MAVRAPDAVVEALRPLGVELRGCASSTAQLVKMALASQSVVALVDIDLPANAIRAVDDLAVQNVAVVVRGRIDAEFELLASLAAGASGFVDVDAGAASVARVVAVVASGGIALPRAAHPVLLGQLRSLGGGVEVSAGGRECRLTHREWEVLLLVCQGRTTGEIADRLFISRATVRTFVSALVHRFGVRTREELVERMWCPHDADSVALDGQGRRQGPFRPDLVAGA